MYTRGTYISTALRRKPSISLDFDMTSTSSLQNNETTSVRPGKQTRLQKCCFVCAFHVYHLAHVKQHISIFYKLVANF